MRDESSAAPSPDLTRETSRRRLLAWMGAGGAAVLATLFSRNEAHAGHDGTNVLHLGEGNTTPPGRKTGIASNVEAFSVDVDNAHTGSAGGLHGRSLGQLPAIQGVGQGPSFAGVFGVSASPSGDFQGGSRDGVQGFSANGTGVRGISQTGTGGEFSSTSGKALQARGRAAFDADVDTFAVHVNNFHTGGLGGGVAVTTRGFHPAVQGNALGSNALAGVLGLSHEGNFTGGTANGPGIGVMGSSGSGSGVEGVSLTGAGVRGHTQPGKTNVAVEAISPDGTALNVLGKSRFSTAGSAVVPVGADSIFVPNSAVTATSHVSVTLVGDPGPRQLTWVERNPGSGFTVHLSSAPPSKRPETPLTYLIVEPG